MSHYSLTVVHGPTGTVFGFLFKTHAAGIAAKTKLDNGRRLPVMGSTIVDIVDDYGQECSFNTNIIHSVLLEDIELGSEAGIERGLNQARAQARGNSRAAQDPTLRASGMFNGGMPGNGAGLVPVGRN